MDKNKCMTKVTRARVMASRVTRARRVLSCLGLMMLLGVSQVAAQNEGNVKKITPKELIPENVIPKDSLSSSSDDKNMTLRKFWCIMPNYRIL